MFDILPEQVIECLWRDSEHRERNLDILKCRLQDDKPDTLKYLSGKHDITEKWVRQIDARGRRILKLKLEAAQEAVMLIPKLNEELERLRVENQTLKIRLQTADENTIPKTVIPIGHYLEEGISVRLANALHNACITTWNQLAEIKERDLWKLRTVGRKTRAEINRKLVELGFRK